jgi:hypothetical protein
MEMKRVKKEERGREERRRWWKVDGWEGRR